MPSIIDGLFAGRAGIQSHGTAISVLADNIANQNTVGFKQSRPDFADLLAGTLTGASAIQTGSGSSIVSVTRLLNQGTFEFTGRGLDMGIDGNGYFVVQDQKGSGQRYYTRAGNFKIDTDGYVLDQNGYRVLGFPANGAGGLEALNVNTRAQDTVGTTTVNISGNLDASSELLAGGEGAIPNANGLATGATFSDLSNTAEFSTFVDIYDSLGASHTVTVFFYHTDANTWTAQAVVDGGEVSLEAGYPRELGRCALAFTSSGSQMVPNGRITMTPNWSNGAAASEMTMTFSPFTQFSANSNIASIIQNGTGSGSVVGFNVEEGGMLFAQLDNGETASIGTIALSIFANAEGLARVGNSLFVETSNSGEPVIGTPNTGTFGAIESGALELSTADIAGDFIKLISIQRGFQGSSRIITNIDDLLNEIINLA